MLTDILMCLIGVFFMFLAFYMTGFRERFSRSQGPYYPVSKAGRVIFFLIGMAVFVNGLEQLLSRSGLSYKGWRVAVSFAAVLLLGLLLSSRLVRAHMGRRGVNYPMEAIEFPSGLPSTMVGTRIAFFVIVAVMVAFGVLPMAASTAETGIVACVFVLFADGLLYCGLEHHYVKTGRAIVQSTDQNEEE